MCLLTTFGVCVGLINYFLPVLAHHSLSYPNERSTHTVPTPQIGGIFILPVFIIGLICLSIFSSSSVNLASVGPLIFGALILGILGWADDRRGLPVLIRLLVHIGVIAALFTLGVIQPLDISGLSGLNYLLSGFILISFINITNFMDGIDGLIVAEFSPMLVLILVLCLFSFTGRFSGQSDMSALNSMPAPLLGSLLGFFVFNRPIARIFLGDVGSLPIGFLMGVLLLNYAREFGIVAAVILPLYFLVDASWTLLVRLKRGEKIWLAHRQHFYQRAFDAGQGNYSILIRVVCCNIVLCILSLFAGTSYGIYNFEALCLSIVCVVLLCLSLKPKVLI
jgi:UDP-N-acetylmuramyl pentapeptide phosphotransferase/UDP-N-acetylglucosamine-1-phosphate transferase